MNKLIVNAFLGGLLTIAPPAAANLKLQSSQGQLCYDLFCRIRVAIPLSLSVGRSATTRDGYAQWTGILDSVRVSQLACTQLSLKQSALINGALALDLEAKPVIGCGFRPKIIVSARKFTNRYSRAKFSFSPATGANRWVSLTGTEISLGESVRGSALLGVRSGSVKTDDGRTVESGFQAEAYPSGWVVSRSPEILVEFSSSIFYKKNRLLRTDSEAIVTVDGRRVSVNLNGEFEALPGQNIGVMSVSGILTRYHYASHGHLVRVLR